MLPILDESFPTLIPALRDLVEAVARCQRTGRPLAEAAPALREADVALGGLWEIFEQALAWQELLPAEEGLVARLRGSFGTLGGSLRRLEGELAGQRPEEAGREVATLVEHVRILEGGLRALRESGASKPLLSHVPAVQLLLQAGRSVRRGGPWALLAGCLEDLLPSWEAVASQPERPPEVEAHGQALEELIRAVQAEDLEALDEALEAVRRTGEALAGEPAPVAARFLCPRCGGEVSEWDRSCPGCHARMPERVREAERPGEPEDLPDYVQALFEAAEGLRAGDWDRFQGCVEEMRRRALACLGLLERLPHPAPGVPHDEWTAWNASQECLENGLERFFQALDDLDSLARSPDPQVLDRGLESVLEAVRETRQVGVHLQRLAENRLA